MDTRRATGASGGYVSHFRNTAAFESRDKFELPNHGWYDPQRAGEGDMTGEGPEGFIERTIIDFVREDPACRRKVDGGNYWGPPLVGFASGDDPLFSEYKTIIGEFHLTPREIFVLAFGEEEPPGELSVISWVLPISADTRDSNRKENRFPSRLWAHTRWFGQESNVALGGYLVASIGKIGHRAVAPMSSPYFRFLKSPAVGYASTWSERHVAYACGLGTFGLSDGLITPKGKAMRVGSVVTDLPMKASERVYPHHRAGCLHFFDGSCRACATRCPAGAITEEGHDKEKCGDYLSSVVFPSKNAEYDVKNSGCGLCQTNVPCESGIPVRRESPPGRNS
jgi:epoxyqueuosine reductase